MDPAGAPVWILQFGDQLTQAGDFARAEKHYRKSLVSAPGNVELMGRLASIQVALGKMDEALETCEAAISANPASVGAYGLKSTIYQRLGRFDDAIVSARRVIELDPGSPTPYLDIVRSKRVGAEDIGLVERLTQMEKDPERGEAGKFAISRALGKAYDDLAQYGLAMEHFERANQIARKQSTIPYDFGEREREAKGAIASFKGPFPREASSPVPVLIAGMIRSGTTLLDSMLSRIDGVASAGEERFWSVNAPPLMAEYASRKSLPRGGKVGAQYLERLKSISNGARWVIDKMPLNYRFLGLIKLAVPQAKIVHLRRHPVDTAISIYSTDFGPSPPPYAFHRERIVHTYRLYAELMAHWQRVLPERDFVQVDYEELVSHPESTMRRVLQSLEILWSDQVLDRSPIEGDVNTPSRWQARQGIYTNSIGRWKKYRPWLGEFSDLLSPEELESD